MRFKRNKTGLAAAKRRGRKLVGNPTAKLTIDACASGRAVLIE